MWWKRENPNSSRSLCSAASSLTCKAWSRLAPTHLNNQILTWYDLAHWHLSWPKFGMKECSLTTFNLCWTFPFLPHLKVGSFIPTFRHDMFLNWTTRQLPWTRPAMRTSSMRRDAPLCTSCARASSVLASPTPRRTFRSGSPNAEHNKSRQLSDLSHMKVTSTHINHQILVPEQHSSFKLPSWYCAPPGTCGKALVDLERSRPFASRPWKSKWRQLQSWKLKLFVCWNGPGLTETWEFPHKTSGLLQKKTLWSTFFVAVWHFQQRNAMEYKEVNECINHVTCTNHQFAPYTFQENSARLRRRLWCFLISEPEHHCVVRWAPSDQLGS